MILLDLGTQLLMLGIVAVGGLGLTDANWEPCLYYILTMMGWSERTRGITKHEVIIQVNHVKLANYTMVVNTKFPFYILIEI